MAARAWAIAVPTDEVLFRNDSVSLCLLLNRRSHTVRIFDFRAGAWPSKRTFVMSVARREHVERLFIVVEREEVGTWTRLGLGREGVIPGFYKRSDAHVLGAVIDPECPERASSRAHRAGPDVQRAESTLRSARTLAGSESNGASRGSPVRLQELPEQELRKAMHAATRNGLALTTFEPFGRDSNRIASAGIARGAPVFTISVEIQPCFDHAFVEWLTAPRDGAQRALYRAGLRLLLERLGEQGVVSVFSLSPADDPSLASVFVSCGFRRTGLLAGHMCINGARRDALLWTRKNAVLDDGGEED